MFGPRVVAERLAPGYVAIPHGGKIVNFVELVNWNFKFVWYKIIEGSDRLVRTQRRRYKQRSKSSSALQSKEECHVFDTIRRRQSQEDRSQTD